MEELNELKISIDHDSPVPIYYQLSEIFRKKIRTGEWANEMKLPTEVELCTLLKVSRNTVRRVYQDLKSEGVVEKKQGIGTFVSASKISHKFVTVVSFTRELIARGIKPESEILSVQIKAADKDVSEKLKITPDKSVVYIERLRLGDNKIMGYNLSRIPLDLCPDIDKLPIGDDSLYTIIEDRYGHKVHKAERILETVPADSDIAEYLNVEVGFPVLKVIGIAYNQNEKPFDYCIEYYKD